MKKKEVKDSSTAFVLKYKYLFLLFAISIIPLLASCENENCGDGVCTVQEAMLASCSSDCGVCRGGNSQCEYENTPCCEGLKEVSMQYISRKRTCESAGCGTICIPCGNGVCEENENTCNCPEDCKTDTCKDFDGGINFYNSAKTCIKSDCKYDSSPKCTTFPCDMIEYYCNDEEIEYKTATCEHGRLNNACLREDLILGAGESCISTVSITDCTSAIWKLSSNQVRVNKIDTESKTFDLINLADNQTYKNNRYIDDKKIDVFIPGMGDIVVVLNEDNNTVVIKGTSDMLCNDSDETKNIFTFGSTNLYTEVKEDNCGDYLTKEVLRDNIIKNNEIKTTNLLTTNKLIDNTIVIDGNEYKIIGINNNINDDSIINEVILSTNSKELILKQGYNTKLDISNETYDIKLIDITESRDSCGFLIDNDINWIDLNECLTINDKTLCVVTPEAIYSRNLDTDQCKIIIGSGRKIITSYIEEFYCRDDVIESVNLICPGECKDGACVKDSNSCIHREYFIISDNESSNNEITGNYNLVGEYIKYNGEKYTITNINSSILFAVKNPISTWMRIGEENTFSKNEKDYIVSVTNMKKKFTSFETDININENLIKLNNTECKSLNNELSVCLPVVKELNSKESNKYYFNIYLGKNLIEITDPKIGFNCLD